MLPVKGSVFFWESEEHWLSKDQTNVLLGKSYQKLPVLCDSIEAAVVEDILIIPVEVEEDDNIAVLVKDIDSGLLQKMAPEWLREFQGTVQGALVRIKQAYVYPETGFYNSRLLDLFWTEARSNRGAFFLLGTQDKIKRSTEELMNIKKIGHLIEATIHWPIFYFGGHIFGMYQEDMSRDKALRFAHRLLGRLKREGLPSVHIGISLGLENSGRKTKKRVLKECWQALETAEKRGPFSLCEVSSLSDQRNNPLALPAPSISRQLQNKWRGLKRFSLLLIRVEGDIDKEIENNEFLAQAVSKICYKKYFYCHVNKRECYVLLPDVSPQKALQQAKKINEKIDAEIKPLQVAVGIGYWPCIDFSKTSVMVNCQKALMHGNFFGPGSVTLFDHVSLNVSGDYFFDEGDYREAVSDYKAGLKINSNEVNLLNSMGVTLTELNRLTEALRYFDLVLEKEPMNYMALVNKGFALKMLKKDENAISFLSLAQNCMEFGSSSVKADILLQLGRLYCETGQYKKAVKVLEKLELCNSEKTGCLIYSLLGKAYAATGANKKSIAMLQRAIQLNPHDAQSMSILGELYEIEGEGTDIALSLCTQAVNLDELSWENWYRLAKVLYAIKDYDKSQDAIGEALNRNRKAVDAIFLAGKLKAKQGKAKQASRLLQRVLRVAPDYPGAAKVLREMIKHV